MALTPSGKLVPFCGTPQHLSAGRDHAQALGRVVVSVCVLLPPLLLAFRLEFLPSAYSTAETGRRAVPARGEIYPKGLKIKNLLKTAEDNGSSVLLAVVDGTRTL